MGISIVIIMGIVSCLIGLLMGYYFDSESSGSENKRVCDTSRNSIEASKLIGKFLKCREWVCRLNVCLSGEHIMKNGVKGRVYLDAIGSGWWVYSGTNIDLCKYFRLWHFLGYEIILRQEGETDELDKTAEQVKTYMRPEFKREGIDYSYPYNKKTL